MRIGAAVLAVLVAVAGWVAWKGAHPDPRLFALPTADGGKTSGGAASLPPGLAPAGWTAGTPSRFDSSNLYVKIDGRADFFLSRGFRSMTFVSLTSTARPGLAVDVEIYDMTTPENALSAFAGEKPPEVEAPGSGYLLRNALFLARGPLYVRAIGSEEGTEITAALTRLRGALETGIAAGEKPWSHAIFERALGVPDDKVGFEKENAFSFAFASGVSVALLADGTTEAFLMPAADAAAAKALAAKFEKGFLDYGEKAGPAGETWVKDRYLNGFSRAEAAGKLVVGIRGAPELESARKALRKLLDDVTAHPPVIPAPATDKGGASSHE